MNIDFASYFVAGLLCILGLVVLLGLKNIFLVRLAFRNFSRKKSSTILVILGSMIGASLISGSLIVNDSFAESSKIYVEQKIGNSTGIIYPRDRFEGWTIEKANEVFSKVNTDFTSFIPIYYQRLTVRNPQKNVTKNDVVVMTFDKNTAVSYQKDLKTERVNYDVKKDEVVLSTSVAKQLGLEAGNDVNISVIDNISLSLKVKTIVDDNGLIGFNSPLQSRFGYSLGSIYISPELIPSLQSTLNSTQSQLTSPALYNAVLVSRPLNYNSATLTKIVQDKLDNYNPNIIFEELRFYLENLSTGNSNGINFGQVLLLVSSFAIAAGLILMINLYYMIAEDRKTELGTLRAIGLKKTAIIKLFTFEGLLYSLISSFIGVLLGIGIGAVFLVIVGNIVNKFASEFDLQTTISLSINANSLLFAFAGSWIVTFLTTVMSSIQIANLNIIEAIRDTKIIREKKLNFKNGSSIGIFMVIGFVFIFNALSGKISSDNLKAYLLYFGFLLVAWAIVFFAKHFKFKNKAATIISLVTIFATLGITQIDFFAKAWKAGPYLFFINAIVLLISFTILIVNNLQIISNSLKFIFGKLPKFRAATAVGLKYPLENKLRTGMTIIIFGLVIFIVTLISILRVQINKVINQVGSEFDIVIIDQLGKENVTELIEKNKDEIKGYESIFNTNLGLVNLPDYKYKDLPSFDPNSPLSLKPEDNYIEAVSTINKDFFTDKVVIKSDKTLEEIKETMSNSSEYILLGKNYFREAGDFNIRPELAINSKVKIKFAGNTEITRTVLGIVENIDASSAEALQSPISSTGNTGILLSEKDYEGLKLNRSVYLSSIYGIKIAKGTDSTQSGDAVKEILRGRNVSSILVVADTVKRATVFLNQLIVLIQGFMAFGLIVGIAGVSVILVRSIHERRHQIGTLRSIGFTENMIVTVFLVESMLLTLLGILIGFGAGVFSSYLFYSFILAEKTGIAYSIPFGEIISIFAVVLLASTIFSYFPARKASKLLPVEATNYLG